MRELEGLRNARARGRENEKRERQNDEDGACEPTAAEGRGHERGLEEAELQRLEYRLPHGAERGSEDLAAISGGAVSVEVDEGASVGGGLLAVAESDDSGGVVVQGAAS